VNPDVPTPFEELGGEDVVRAIVDAFYDRMDSWEGAAPIRAMHPKDLTESREKLHDFLCGWLGGPPRYVQKHGHPRLRARHLPFPIDVSARDQWLACMAWALEANVAEVQLREGVYRALGRLADHMRNRAESAPDSSSHGG
jgi:hemoglobin